MNFKKLLAIALLSAPVCSHALETKVRARSMAIDDTYTFSGLRIAVSTSASPIMVVSTSSGKAIFTVMEAASATFTSANIPFLVVSSISGNGSLLTNLNASALATGTIPNARLDGSSVTLQGNSFNGPNQLAKLDSSGFLLHALLDPSSVTKLGAAIDLLELSFDVATQAELDSKAFEVASATSTLKQRVDNLDFSTGTLSSRTSLLETITSNLQTSTSNLNASALTHGTVPNARLDSSVFDGDNMGNSITTNPINANGFAIVNSAGYHSSVQTHLFEGATTYDFGASTTAGDTARFRTVMAENITGMSPLTLSAEQINMTGGSQINMAGGSESQIILDDNALLIDGNFSLFGTRIRHNTRISLDPGTGVIDLAGDFPFEGDQTVNLPDRVTVQNSEVDFEGGGVTYDFETGSIIKGEEIQTTAGTLNLGTAGETVTVNSDQFTANGTLTLGNGDGQSVSIDAVGSNAHIQGDAVNLFALNTINIGGFPVQNGANINIDAQTGGGVLTAAADVVSISAVAGGLTINAATTIDIGDGGGESIDIDATGNTANATADDTSITGTNSLSLNSANLILPTAGISGGGAGSGLDADLLDGMNPSDIVTASNVLHSTNPAFTWTGDAGSTINLGDGGGDTINMDASGGALNLVSSGGTITLDATSGGDNAIRLIAGGGGNINLDADNIIWNVGVGSISILDAGTFNISAADNTLLPTSNIQGAGSGSGLDADLLDGQDSTSFANAAEVATSTESLQAQIKASTETVSGFNANATLASGTTVQSLTPGYAAILTRIDLRINVSGAGGTDDTVVCGDGVNFISVTATDASAPGSLFTGTGNALISADTMVDCRMDTDAATKPFLGFTLHYVRQ